MSDKKFYLSYTTKPTPSPCKGPLEQMKASQYEYSVPCLMAVCFRRMTVSTLDQPGRAGSKRF